MRLGAIKTLSTCFTCQDWQAQEWQAKKRVTSAALSEFNDCIVRQHVNIANRTYLYPEYHSLLFILENCFTCFSLSPSPSQAETAQPV